MPPQKILKVETKICAIGSILEVNLKKSSTLKFMTNISFCTFSLHSQIHHLNFHRKNYACRFFFPQKIFFPMIFDFHFRENPRFCDKFQALNTVCIKMCNVLPCSSLQYSSKSLDHMQKFYAFRKYLIRIFKSIRNCLQHVTRWHPASKNDPILHNQHQNDVNR